MRDPVSERRRRSDRDSTPPSHRMPEGTFLYEKGIPIVLVVLGAVTLILIVAVVFVVLSTLG